MEEKDIILRINAITDKEVMEEFGEVLNDVLGSYEENVRLLGQYNSEIKNLKGEINALMKIEEKQGGLTEEQQERLARLTAEERKYRQASSEVQQTLKNEEKIRTTANGSMENQAQLLGKLRMAWRKMTDEQKKANPQMLRAIESLDKHMKGADASIGNFQRNVGNYPGLMAQAASKMSTSVASLAGRVNPAFGSIADGVMNVTQQMGLTTGAIAGISSAFGVAALGFKMFKDSMELTQTVGDAVAVKVAGWEAVYDKFIRMIVSADFSNFWGQLTKAKEAAENLTATLDEMFERENALKIAEAKLSEEQETNLTIMRDMTKSYEERKKAGEAYIDAAQEMADRRKAIAEQEYKDRLADFATQTGLEEQQVTNFIENYETYRDIANEYAALQQEVADQRKYISDFNIVGDAFGDLEKLKEARNKLANFYNSLTDAQREFLESQEKYNNANDEMTEKLVAAWIKTLTATSEALKATRRASTTVSSITAQQQKEAERKKQEQKRKEEQEERERLQKERAKVNASTQILKQFGAETDALIDEFLGTKFEQYRERVNEEMAQMVADSMDYFAAMEEELDNTLSQAAATIKPIKQSPLAKALGVTDEQLTTIKSQAMQAAQQIFGSIQQIAQQASQRRLDNELKAVETEAEQEKAILKEKLDSGAINKKQYEKKIAEIDKQAEARREEAQKEAFEKEKRWNIATALMNAAMAITQVFRSTPPPASFIMAGITAATTAAQIATIASQKYARGGELHGASHAQGGIKGNIQGHNIELEGDEVVINKRSAHKYRSLLSYINSDNGWGVDFAGVRGNGGYRPQLKYARGGVLGSYDFSPASVPQASLLQKQMERQVEQTEAMIAATNRRIDRLQVQVNISDIEGASNTKRVHINRAKL